MEFSGEDFDLINARINFEIAWISIGVKEKLSYSLLYALTMKMKMIGYWNKLFLYMWYLNIRRLHICNLLSQFASESGENSF